MDTKALPPKLAIERLGIGRTLFYRLLAEGKLKAKRISERRIVITEAEIHRFLSSLPAR